MADDEDDEAFGDFAFAPFQSDSKSNCPDSLAAAEDDWGDFVKSPQGSNPSGPSHQGNRPSDKHVSPPRWVKPSGALPLSIFGVADEEEEGNLGVSGDFNQEKSSAVAGDFDSTSANKGASNSQNLSIADLYNQYASIRPDKSPGPNYPTGVAPVQNEVYLSLNQDASGSVISKSKIVDLNDPIGIENRSHLTNKCDNEEFGFKSYLPDPSKNGDLFGPSAQEYNGVNSNLNTITPNLQTSNPGLDMKNQKQHLDGSDDNGGDGWEFKDAHSEFWNEKVNNSEVSKRNTFSSGSVNGSRKSNDVIGTSNGSVNFFEKSTGSIDYFASSSGFSTTSMEVDVFGIQTEARTLNGLTTDTRSNIDQTSTKGMKNHSPDVGSREFDEGFGEFTSASAETESKPQEASTDDVSSPSKGPVPTSDDKIQVDFMMPELSERSANSPESVSGLNKPPDVFGTSNGSINFFATSAESVDYFSTLSSISSTSKEMDLFGTQSRTINGFISHTNSNIEENKLKGIPDHKPYIDTAESDEDFGEFTAAAAETGPKPGGVSTSDINPSSKDTVSTMNGEIQVDLMVDEVSERRENSSMSASGSKKALDLFEMPNGSTNLFGTSTEAVDYFAPSSGISRISQEVDWIGIQTGAATFDDFSPDKNSTIEQNNIKVTLNHIPDVGDSEFDDDFGEFTAASTKTGQQAVEASTNNVLFPSEVESTMDGKIQEKDSKLNYQKGAIPLSIFGFKDSDVEESESGGSSDVQNLFKYQFTSDQRNRPTPKTVLSVKDLISSLYSQAEQQSPMYAVHKPTKTESHPSDAVSSSVQVNEDKHLDDSIWDLKDAPQTMVDSEASLYSIGDTYLNVSSKLKFNGYLDFYHKLKDEQYFVVKCHIESLRQAAGNATLSGEDTRAASFDSEFQLVCKELEQMKLPFEHSNFQDHSSGEHSFNEFLEVLLEPEFQRLESEYHLSNKLLLAEKDLRSAMELLRHATAMLKILTIGTLEERRAYISIWNEMISVCALELKCGASIWNQAVEKQIHGQLLSEPQGRKFFLALGEIYRVVAVLGASAKLYRPWTYSGLVDLPAIDVLLEECHAIWSSSGLEEALSSVSVPSDASSLLKSIKHILSLDALALQNYVFAGKESLCQLSILTAEAMPGMKKTEWGSDQCFVALANLWANLISRNPPELPQLSLG